MMAMMIMMVMTGGEALDWRVSGKTVREQEPMCVEHECDV